MEENYNTLKEAAKAELKTERKQEIREEMKERLRELEKAKSTVEKIEGEIANLEERADNVLEDL